MQARTRRRHRFITHLLAHIALFSLGILFLLPFVWMLGTSLKSDAEIFTRVPVWIPKRLIWSNYAMAFSYVPFALYFANTLIICAFAVLGTILSCPLVAYSFSRISWPGRDFFFIVMLSTLMLPYHVTLIPIFIVFRNLGWINTFKPLTVPYFFGSPFYIFLVRQFFLTIPRELSDAAKIDGCSELGIYSRIILPLSKPILATISLFTFVGQWQDFLGPLIFLNDAQKYTLAIGLYAFRTQHGAEWAAMMAAATVMVMPMIIVFFFTQRTFIQAITLTGLKE